MKRYHYWLIAAVIILPLLLLIAIRRPTTVVVGPDNPIVYNDDGTVTQWIPHPDDEHLDG